MSPFLRDDELITKVEHRQAPRVRLAIPARLQTQEGRQFQTLLRDLSLSGFSASARDRIPVGDTCWLTLPGRQAMAARVIWWDRARVGCAFETLIPRITYDAILERW